MDLNQNHTYIWYQAMKNGVPNPTTAKVATLTASHGLFLTDVGRALSVNYTIQVKGASNEVSNIECVFVLLPTDAS
jgi:hypothetical protein